MNLLNVYNKIIVRSKTRILESGISYDKHRIVAGFEGGEYVSDNLAFLTRKEHKIIHLIRWKLYGCWQDYQAARVLGQRNYKNPWNKGKTGFIKSEESRKKLSDSLKGRNYVELYGKEKANWMKEIRSFKMSETMTGKVAWNKGIKCSNISAAAKNRPPVTEETRQKMRESAKRRRK